MDDIIKVKARPKRRLFGSDNFKIFSFDLIENVEGKVYLNQYKNFTAKGDYQELALGEEYILDLIYEGEDKYGHQYKAISVFRDKPKTEEETMNFFKGIINEKKLKALYEVYPNFVDMILQDKPFDTSKIKGVKGKSLQKIKDAVIDNIGLMDFYTEFSKFGLANGDMKKIKKRYGTVDNFKEKLEKDIYRTLLDIDGIGFLTADKIALSLKPELAKSVSRMVGCIRYYIDDVKSQGNTWISIKKLYKFCVEHTPECISKFDLAIQDKLFFYDSANNLISLLSIYEEEKEICNTLFEMLSLSKDSSINVNLEKIFNSFDFELTENQKQAVENVFKYKVSILGGFAGSGKTFSTQVIVKALENLNMSYALAAPTGKASQQISIYTNREASTIHRLLDYNPSKETGFFGFNEENKLDYDVIFIDENSMTDIFLLKHLLRAIDIQKTRIIFIQDFAQIPSVSYGNVAYDLVQSGVIPTTKLDKIFRYDKGGLMKVATDTRNGKQFVSSSNNDKYTVFGEDKDFMIINSEGVEIVERLKQGYSQLISRGVNPIDILVLSSMNKGDYGTVQLNKHLQPIANPKSDDKKEVIINNMLFRENDLIIQTRNNYKGIKYEDNFLDYIYDEDTLVSNIEIFNGNFGIIKEIKTYLGRNYFIIEFNGVEVIYEEKDMRNVLLGYSITTFKAQGSSSDYAFVILPNAHKYMLNRNLMYVAFTRAKIKCYALGTHLTINSTLLKSAQLSRDTFLKHLLMEKAWEIENVDF